MGSWQRRIAGKARDGRAHHLRAFRAQCRKTDDTGSVALAIIGASAGIAALVVVGLPILITSAEASTNSSSSGLVAGAVCATSGPIEGLSDTQARNARTVVAVAAARGGDSAAVITLMVGLAESGLRVLTNSNTPTAEIVATVTLVGVGHDHDSLGIFQQRPSWGTAAQRLDPVTSANLFLDRLLATEHWQTDVPWRVAQDVQQSAYDGVPRSENNFSSEYGGNYHAQLARAIDLLDVIKRDSAHLICTGTGGSAVGAGPSGPLDAHGLPTAFTLPSDTSAPARTAVLAALQALGRPYVFGEQGPNAFDCSGLTRWAWAAAGIDLPHYTVDQWHEGTATNAANLQPGDLVLTPGADGSLADPQHVGMYIGSDLVIEAPQTGDVVKVVTYDSFTSAGLSGLRHIA